MRGIRRLFEVYERFDFVVVDHVDLVNFVRSAETVEEVKERNAGFDGGKIRHQSEIHNFLNAVGCEHRKTGLTASHHVGVVTENVESVACNASCGYVEHAGEQFARNLVHVGDHKEQALARGEGAGQCACCQRAVNCACRARFGLHFSDFENVAEKILSALSCPIVAVFRHR